MTEHRLRQTIGLFLIAAHVAVIAIFLMSPFFGVLFHQGSELASVAAPLFAGYTTAIIRRLVRDRRKLTDVTPRVNLPFAILSFLFPALLTVAVIYVFFGYAKWGFIEDFTTVKRTIVGLEALIGVYVGFLIDSLFAGAAKNRGRTVQKVPDASIQGRGAPRDT